MKVVYRCACHQEASAPLPGGYAVVIADAGELTYGPTPTCQYIMPFSTYLGTYRYNDKGALVVHTWVPAVDPPRLPFCSWEETELWYREAAKAAITKAAQEATR
jgi:hypothetical protein